MKISTVESEKHFSEEIENDFFRRDLELHFSAKQISNHRNELLKLLENQSFI